MRAAHTTSQSTPNGLELSCPAEAGRRPPILAHAGGPGAPPYGPARRVSFSELLGGQERHKGSENDPKPRGRDAYSKQRQYGCEKDPYGC